MITVQLTFNERTVSDTLAAATAHGLSFNDCVEWLLNFGLDAVGINDLEPAQSIALAPAQTFEELAAELYVVALDEQAEEKGDGYEVEARPYLVEDLYKRRAIGTEWNSRDRGSRIMIGKAFKRYVDEQVMGRQREDGRVMKVEFHSRTAQNQTKYKTVRVG